MGQMMRMASYALAATLALSGFAFAQRDRDDDDDHYRRDDTAQARQYGYQNGYNDGVGKGRHEGRERDPNDYQTPDWRQAMRGYQRWMGPADLYQRAYQEGYRNGFRSGYEQVAEHGRDRDRDYSWQQHDGWRMGYDQNWGDAANRFGYEDGAVAAREDIEHRKSYNSEPRGRFGHRDHGYQHEFGSKDRYKDQYTSGYRAGYDSVMGRRY